ncbi:hypothetical protein [Sulfitobacter guttiformis]|uniref:Uncharacterized protein n=1 Tax=Sulfitobacter guttiformis TaxID=74349 RepID=A0A420DR08_9RHOB|nr:hypothetical protein [Sulfitobacter guttiformis]KIN74066.1 hypothetical protein Z949_3261 [Sulfitobacter guttiformis KCTC 32187]RKE96685.1 hypothetical protein C8N30_1252 [Sulfitobacter guttiformis]
MAFVNFVLVGLLGTMLAISLYMAKVQISYENEMRSVPHAYGLS